jgi:predicted RNA-binding protein YlxR (DUF448 family)
MPVPARTCIGCRVVCAAGDLVRLVAIGDRVIVAPGGSSAGRGAWLHPRDDCFQAAVKARAFARAFRRSMTMPAPGEFMAALAAQAAHAAKRAASQRE